MKAEGTGDEREDDFRGNFSIKKIKQLFNCAPLLFKFSCQSKSTHTPYFEGVCLPVLIASNIECYLLVSPAPPINVNN